MPRFLSRPQASHRQLTSELGTATTYVLHNFNIVVVFTIMNRDELRPQAPRRGTSDVRTAFLTETEEVRLG